MPHGLPGGLPVEPVQRVLEPGHHEPRPLRSFLPRRRRGVRPSPCRLDLALELGHLRLRGGAGVGLLLLRGECGDGRLQVREPRVGVSGARPPAAARSRGRRIRRTAAPSGVRRRRRSRRGRRRVRRKGPCSWLLPGNRHCPLIGRPGEAEWTGKPGRYHPSSGQPQTRGPLLGPLRLGELRVRHDRDGRALPGLLQAVRSGGGERRADHAPPRRGQHGGEPASPSSPRYRCRRRPRGRKTEVPPRVHRASGSSPPPDRRPRPPGPGSRRSRSLITVALFFWSNCLSSTTRCFPTWRRSPATTRSRRWDTRSDTSAAACCSS